MTAVLRVDPFVRDYEEHPRASFKSEELLVITSVVERVRWGAETVGLTWYERAGQ